MCFLSKYIYVYTYTSISIMIFPYIPVTKFDCTVTLYQSFEMLEFYRIVLNIFIQFCFLVPAHIYIVSDK